MDAADIGDCERTVAVSAPPDYPNFDSCSGEAHEKSVNLVRVAWQGSCGSGVSKRPLG